MKRLLGVAPAALVAALLSVPPATSITQPLQPASSEKKKCKYVTKTVRGKKKRVRVCRNVPAPKPKPKPKPPPPPPAPPAPPSPRVEELLGWSTSSAEPPAIVARSGGAITTCGAALPRLGLTFRYSGFSGQAIETLWTRDGLPVFTSKRSSPVASAGVQTVVFAPPAGVRDNGRYDVDIRSADVSIGRATLTVRCPPAFEFLGWATSMTGAPPPIAAAVGGTISECGADRSILALVVRYGFLPEDATIGYVITRDGNVVLEDWQPVTSSGLVLLGVQAAAGAIPNGTYAIDVRLAGSSFGRPTVTVNC